MSGDRQSTLEADLHPGDYVRDRIHYEDFRRGERDDEPGVMVVLKLTDTRASEYDIRALGKTVHEAAGHERNWLSPDDQVVEVVFIADLERQWGPEWVTYQIDTLRERCEESGVRTYSYHLSRLEPTRFTAKD